MHEIIEIEELNKVKAQLNKILNLSLDIICTINDQGEFILVNNAAFKTWGYHPEKLIGKAYINYVYSEDRELTTRIVINIMNGVNNTNFKNRFIRKDGSLVSMIWSARWDEDEKIIYCVGRDATTELDAKNHLQLREQRFKSLVKNGADLISIFDQQGTCTYTSPSSFSVLGKKPEELINKNIVEFIHAEDIVPTVSCLKKLKYKKQVHLPAFRILYKDGSWIWVETIVTNLLKNVPINGLIANSRNVTDRINAEDKLKASEEKYKLLFELSPLPSWVFDLNTSKIVAVNETAIIRYGYTSEEFLDMIITDIRPDNDKSRLMTITERLLTLEGVNYHDSFIHLKQGTQIKVEVSGHRLSYQGKDCMMILCNDVTERSNAIEQLKESEKKLRTATKIARLGYWQVNLNGTNRYWSDEVYNIWNETRSSFSIESDSLLKTIHPEDQEAFETKQSQSFAGAKEINIEYRILTSNGTTKWVHEKGNPLIIQGTVQDITIQKLLALSLEESNQRYRYVTQATFDGIWDWDIIRNTLYRGEGYKDITGKLIQTCDFDINSWKETLHPQDIDRIKKSLYEVFDSLETNWCQEYRILKKDGTYAFVVDRAFVIRDKKGTAVKMVGAMQDISTRKKAEEELKL